MSSDPLDQAAPTEPFPGPRPFATSESALFKGREKESRDVRDLILSYQVVVLYAKSGAGKSSLVNAGLRPLLIEAGFEILPVVRVGGKIPPQVDRSKVANVFVFNALSTCLGVTTDPASLLDVKLSDYLGQVTSQKSQVLVLDQFEELFTAFPERWQDREPFFLELEKACQSNKDLRLLMVIREDHLAELDAYADLLPNSLRIRYRLERLREDEALQAVVLPMRLAGYAFEEGVDKELVANLRRIHIQTEDGTKEVTGEFVEPVHLQVVCRNLWNNRPREKQLLTSGDVKKFADVSESLAAFYAKAVRAAAAQTRVTEGAIRSWMEKKLITAGGTRGLVYMGRISTEGLPNEAVILLEQEHVVSAESRAGALWYELTHDRFIGPIRASNRSWFAPRRRRKSIAWAATAALVVVVVAIPAYRYNKDLVEKTAAQRAEQQVEAVTELAQSEMRQGRDQAQDKDWDEALKHYNAALQLYTRLRDGGGQASAYVEIAKVYFKESRFNDAASAYKRALLIHMGRDDAATASDLRSLGDVLQWTGDYRGAEDCLNQSLELYSQLDPPKPKEEASARSSLANLYTQRGDYSRAAALYTKIIRILFDNDDSTGAFQMTLNLGVVLSAMGQRAEGFKAYEKALAAFQITHDRERQGDALVKMARWYVEGNGCNQGIKLASQAFKIFEGEKNAVGEMLAKQTRARGYLCVKSLEEAAVEAQQALDLATHSEDKWSEAYNRDTLALVAEAKGDPQAAIDNGQKAVALYDSMGSHTVYAKSARANLIRWQNASGRARVSHSKQNIEN